jgi:DNA polymerase IV
MQPSNSRRIQHSGLIKKTPAIVRTTSASISNGSVSVSASMDVVKETPPLTRKSSLLHGGLSTLEFNDTSISETPVSKQNSLTNPQRERTAAMPTIGSVVMKNSTGIDSMLKNTQKRKRKDPSIKLVPEKDRIFSGHTFYYIPANDIAPLRRLRITKARNYGAVWTKEVRSVLSWFWISRTVVWHNYFKHPKSVKGVY